MALDRWKFYLGLTVNIFKRKRGSSHQKIGCTGSESRFIQVAAMAELRVGSILYTVTKSWQPDWSTGL